MSLQSCDAHWESLYFLEYGEINSVTRDAATLAKSWKELFRCKTVTDRKTEPRYEQYASSYLPSCLDKT